MYSEKKTEITYRYVFLFVITHLISLLIKLWYMYRTRIKLYAALRARLRVLEKLKILEKKIRIKNVQHLSESSELKKWLLNSF